MANSRRSPPERPCPATRDIIPSSGWPGEAAHSTSHRPVRRHAASISASVASARASWKLARIVSPTKSGNCDTVTTR